MDRLTVEQKEAIKHLSEAMDKVMAAYKNGITETNDQFVDEVRQELIFNMPGVMIENL